MQRATTEFTPGTIIQLNPGSVLVKASTFPLQGPVGFRRGTHKSGQQVARPLEGVKDWPRHLPGKQGERVLRAERQLDRFGQLQMQQPMYRKDND